MNTENMKEIVKQLEKGIKLQKNFEKFNEVLNKTYGLVKTTQTYRIEEMIDGINEKIADLISDMSNLEKEELIIHVVPKMNDWRPNTLCNKRNYKGFYVTIRDYLDQSRKPLVCEDCSKSISIFMLELGKHYAYKRLDVPKEFSSKLFEDISFSEWEVEKMNLSPDDITQFLPNEETLEEFKERLNEEEED
jgi:hypothetical protein